MVSADREDRLAHTAVAVGPGFIPSIMNRIRLYLSFLFRNWWSAARVVDASSGVVVTLTSHSGRVRHAFAAIESIGRGSFKPSRLILYLGRNHESQALPGSLNRLLARGLEVRFCDDVGPHTKYYPHLLAEPQLDIPLVTADDDKMMDADWLLTLMNRWRQEPELIHCFRAREIKLHEDRLGPYSTWPLCKSDQPSVLHFATGVSGVIYPPAFQQLLKTAGNAFRECCPRADDLWLHVIALRHGYRIRQVSQQSLEFPGIPGMSRYALRRVNVDAQGNDRQILNTYQADDISRLMTADAKVG